MIAGQHRSNIGTVAVGMEQFVVRRAELKDISELARMFHCLWPDATEAKHAQDLTALLTGKFATLLPAVVLVAENAGNRMVGFVEISLRSHADGCDPSHPIGYIEGWYVTPAYRRKKVGATLIAAAEDWAREQGCTEMASDAWLDALDSQRAHEALGFEVVDRCVHYRKDLK